MNTQLTHAGQRFLQNETSQQVRLSQLVFTDLFIHEVAQVKMMGAEDAEGPLVDVPDNAIADIDDIRQIVMQKGQTADEFRIEYDGIRYRVTKIVSDAEGVWYTLRRLRGRPPRLKELKGFATPVMRHLGWLGEEPQKGLILLAGPTGHGKTTTASSLLIEYLIKYGRIAVTIEDPPELLLDGAHGKFGHCFQQALKPGHTFGSALVTSMRQSPRFIFISEMRRPEDAREVLAIAISGHVVISTIHAGDPIEAINRLVTLVAADTGSAEYAREQVANGLAGVIHQRLREVRDPQTKKMRKLLQVKTLFMGLADSNERTLVREGKTAQLQTNIEQQLARVMQDKDPVLPDASERGGRSR